MSFHSLCPSPLSRRECRALSSTTCHRSCFGVYASPECRTNDTQERWQLLLFGQAVKLSGWSHGPSRALSHDRAHVPSPDHDSLPLMIRHVAGPYLLIYQPHFPLTPLCPTTLLVGCTYPYRQPHFWLDATLSFSSSDSYRFVPATLLTGPHTHSSPFYLYLLLPSMYKHGLCALVCAHPSSYISI